MPASSAWAWKWSPRKARSGTASTGLRKDNTGYDLRDLFIGSEGTLGIITAATLKLYPQPAAQLTAWAAVPSLEAAVPLLGLAHQRLSAGLTGFEVMGQFALSLVNKHFPALRVPLWADESPCVRPAGKQRQRIRNPRPRHGWRACWKPLSNKAIVSDAVVAESLAQANGLWHIRESIPLAQAEEGLNIKHDISIPVSRIPAFCAETDALLQREIPGVRLVNFGHLGDGNLHYNVQAPADCRCQGLPPNRGRAGSIRWYLTWWRATMAPSAPSTAWAA